MPPLGGGLWRCTCYPSLLRRGYKCLSIVEFSFVNDKVGEIVDGILVYMFHEGLNDGFWEF